MSDTLLKGGVTGWSWEQDLVKVSMTSVKTKLGFYDLLKWHKVGKLWLFWQGFLKKNPTYWSQNIVDLVGLQTFYFMTFAGLFYIVCVYFMWLFQQIKITLNYRKKFKVSKHFIYF